MAPSVKTNSVWCPSNPIHCRKSHVFDGIRYCKSPATAMPQWGDRWEDGDATLGFLKCQVSGNGIDVTFEPLAKVSREKGYGPGGHPRPEARDYSIAWEKS